MEIGDMASTELVIALTKLMDSGVWKTKESLMGDVLQVYPGSFGSLSEADAKIVFNYGNEVLISRGDPIVYVEPINHLNVDDSITERTESIGRCVDLWRDESPRRFARPVSRSKTFRHVLESTMNNYRND
jgi:hypothetical protein